MSPPVVTAALEVVGSPTPLTPRRTPWHSTHASHDTTLTISSIRTPPRLHPTPSRLSPYASHDAPACAQLLLQTHLQHPRRKATLPLSSAALRLTAHSCTKGCLLCYFALSCLRPSSRS